ncbi:DUF3040 domain-containing protein [Streptomyces sp. NPDC090106]|uniref:DUF3040 domain-containing protein n=1 Tax=Streptomyces sp. NPDC090106 TaxID=3365946 RepID=UPI0037FA4895
MARFEDQRLVALAARYERDDPGFAHAMSTGVPRRRRAVRRVAMWWVLAVSLAVFGIGVLVPSGLLIAAGLVFAGVAAQLLDPHRDRGRTAAPDT